MSHHPTTPPLPADGRWGFRDYFWFVLKNVLGWTLIISSGPLGMLVPGPGGIPIFVIGFALITFPGKRRLTARILRGRPVRPDSRGYLITVAAIAILLPGAVISFFLDRWWPFIQPTYGKAIAVAFLYLCSAILLWIFGIRGYHVINLALSLLAKGRRKARPWMRKHGLDLLPPRRRFKLRFPGIHCEPDHEILEIHQRHRERARRIWTLLKPWIIHLSRLAAIVAVFWWMLRPVVREWPNVQHRLADANLWQFAVAALMFAAFLFVFRALVWWRIVLGFGHRLPVPAAVRIWSFSELARYVPGVIWQVVGRVYLSRPYGLSASVSSASQVLELSIFMLSNVLVALTCLAAAGLQRALSGEQQWALFGVLLAAAFIPLLLLLLHPKIFYGALNNILARFHKPPIAPALRKRQLTALVAWTILGLLWQSLAIWLLTHTFLGLPLAKWYVVAGCYCLAWTMGFSVGFLFPGGIGVRELVFVATMQVALPPQWAQANLADATAYVALLRFLGVLLRLWAISGELTMSLAAFLTDYRGATNHPNAPGRLPAPTPEP